MGVSAKDLRSGLKTAGNWNSGSKFTNRLQSAEQKGTIVRRGPKFGFIQCDGFPEEIFVLADQLKNYQEGQIVRFTAFNDAQGKVSAKDLRSGLKPAGNWLSKNKFANRFANKFNTRSPNQSRRWIQKKDTSGGILGEKTGTIAKRGWKFGFIQCDEFDEEVFVLGDELKQYKPGHVVKFTAYTDDRGMVSGKDLKSGLK